MFSYEPKTTGDVYKFLSDRARKGGLKGGKSRSPKKRKALIKNLRKARIALAKKRKQDKQGIGNQV